MEACDFACGLRPRAGGALHLETMTSKQIPLESRGDDGWFELVTDAGQAGHAVIVFESMVRRRFLIRRRAFSRTMCTDPAK